MSGKRLMLDHVSKASRGEHLAMAYLSRAGVSNPSQLALALKASSGRVSAILSSLEKKGYITRDIDPEDRRNILVSLTESGRERAEKDMEVVSGSMRWVFAQMGRRRSHDFLDLLDEFVTYMSVARPGEPLPTDKEVAEAFAQARQEAEHPSDGMFPLC
ncbi:MarR family winged helix-turn-helix transcriptional regulator [Bifidobacterium aemilianum]